MAASLHSNHSLKRRIPYILIFCSLYYAVTNQAVSSTDTPSGNHLSCEVALENYRSALDQLKPLQAVEWHFGIDQESTRVVRGRVLKTDTNYVYLHTLGLNGSLVKAVFLKDRLAKSLVRWVLPTTDSLHSLDEILRFCFFFSENENEIFSQQCRQEDEARELFKQQQNALSSTQDLTTDDLPPTSAILAVQTGNKATLETIEKQTFRPHFAYRSVVIDGASESLAPQQAIEIQFEDTEKTLKAIVMVSMPLVLKINLIKPNGALVWGLVWMDPSKIQSIRLLTPLANHLSKGQMVNWFFKREVKGLHSFSGKILEISKDGSVRVSGLNPQRIPSRWQFTPEELLLVEPVNVAPIAFR